MQRDRGYNHKTEGAPGGDTSWSAECMKKGGMRTSLANALAMAVLAVL